MTTPLTPEERLARLEGVYEHLATKADIAELKADLKGRVVQGLEPQSLHYDRSCCHGGGSF